MENCGSIGDVIIRRWILTDFWEYDYKPTSLKEKLSFQLELVGTILYIAPANVRI